jgi:glutathione S-transferase
MDFPIEHMANMEQRLRQQGWLIADRMPPADFIIPPIAVGFCRRYGIDWVEPA